MIVLALPTIAARENAWEAVAKKWIDTCPEPLIAVPSWRKGGWAAGLNEVWEKHPQADIFICGSDDIYPEGEWLPSVEEWLTQDKCPVPLMKDPRFEIQGGVITAELRHAGEPSHMTNFPVLKGEWLESVFPIPPDRPQHYFADNEISDRLHAIGVETVYAPDFVIVHGWDTRGRGAGMGSEETRMAHDRAIYKRLAG